LNEKQAKNKFAFSCEENVTFLPFLRLSRNPNDLRNSMKAQTVAIEPVSLLELMKISMKPQNIPPLISQ